MDCLNFPQSKSLTVATFAGYTLTTLLSTFVISTILVAAIGRLIVPNKDDTQDKKDAEDKYLKMYDKGVTPAGYFFTLFITALRAGITEELFFRFFIMKTLLMDQMKLNPVTAIIVSAILFGATHMGNAIAEPDKGVSQAVLQSINAGVGGIIDGFVYWKSGSIFVSMLSHFIYDLILMMLSGADYAKWYDDHKKGKQTSVHSTIFRSPRLPTY